MEELIELVAASLARMGRMPSRRTQDGKIVDARVSSPVQADPAALPEHNFRKGLQGDPAP